MFFSQHIPFSFWCLCCPDQFKNCTKTLWILLSWEILAVNCLAFYKVHKECVDVTRDIWKLGCLKCAVQLTEVSCHTVRVRKNTLKSITANEKQESYQAEEFEPIFLQLNLNINLILIDLHQKPPSLLSPTSLSWFWRDFFVWFCSISTISEATSSSIWIFWSRCSTLPFTPKYQLICC